jgi:hypothetical protein
MGPLASMTRAAAKPDTIAGYSLVRNMRSTAKITPRPGLTATLLFLVAVQAGCAASEPLLNSERIGNRFGTFGIDVIKNDHPERISNLYSMEDGRKICRTYAIVRFEPALNPGVRAEHSLVLAGQPMGAVFKSRGWKIIKRNLEIGSRTLTEADLGIAALMRVAVPRPVAYHTYVFAVSRGGVSVDYAVITEIHHPDYLSRRDLQIIYGDTTETPGVVPLKLRGSGTAVTRG